VGSPPFGWIIGRGLMDEMSHVVGMVIALVIGVSPLLPWVPGMLEKADDHAELDVEQQAGAGPKHDAGYRLSRNASNQVTHRLGFQRMCAAAFRQPASLRRPYGPRADTPSHCTEQTPERNLKHRLSENPRRFNRPETASQGYSPSSLAAVQVGCPHGTLTRGLRSHACVGGAAPVN
jgi:hypothetical protein